MSETFSADEIRQMLREECEEAGGMRAWARRHKISAPYVSRVLRGEKSPADAIAAVFGLKQIVVWTVDNDRKGPR
jgi:hypothetical protein